MESPLPLRRHHPQNQMPPIDRQAHDAITFKTPP
jgi:hypothetical protein